jgi:hypothetical protein
MKTDEGGRIVNMACIADSVELKLTSYLKVLFVGLCGREKKASLGELKLAIRNA